MRKLAFGGATFLALAFLACSNFGSEDSPGTTPPGVDGGDEAGDGSAPRDGYVLQPFAAEPPFVIQGKRIKIPVKIMRGAAFEEPVSITLATPPKGITQLGNAIITGESIDVELEVDASFKQGIVELLFEARSERTVAQTGKPKIFVRGPSGSLDTTFATTGILETGFDASMKHVVDAVVLPDRRIVLISTCLKNLYYTCTVRLSESGAIDASYGAGGLAVSAHQYGYLGALSAGKIVIAAGGASFDNLPVTLFSLARLEANGDPDPTFGDPATPGIRNYPGPFFFGMGGIFVDTSNRLVFPLTTSDGQTVRLQVLRTTPNGLPDTTFGTNGFATDPNLVDYFARGLVFSGDKMVINARNKAGNMLVARLDGNGALDPSYGASSGFTTFPIGTTDSIFGIPVGIVTTSEGATLASHEIPQNDVRATKITADGKSLVSAYGSQGVAPYGGRLNAQLIATQGNKLLALTTGGAGSIARLEADGKVDTTFGTNGVLDLSAKYTVRATTFGTDRIIVSGGRSASDKTPSVRRFWL